MGVAREETEESRNLRQERIPLFKELEEVCYGVTCLKPLRRETDSRWAAWM